MKALVTGGAGFIGRWLVHKLLRAGHQVCAYDNLAVGSKTNLQGLEGPFTLVQADILDTQTLASLIRAEQFDIIYHLAAYHYIPFCESHPTLTMRVNVEGTVAVLDACRHSNRPHFVFASTGALYPSVDEALDESMKLNPTGDVYGLSKWMGEQAVQYYHQRYELPCTIVRLFNTYGPYETNPHLLPHIIESLKAHPDYVELGNIKPKRDYIYVEDVAEALRSLTQPSNHLRIFNIGTGEEYSVEEMVQAIAQLLGHPIQIVQDPTRMRPSDKMHQRASITRIQSEIGWTPQYDIHAGLTALLRHEGLIS
ncbi:MAG: NAD(P)-dependent oxidoreductase [Fimbriimonadales bacterium]